MRRCANNSVNCAKCNNPLISFDIRQALRGDLPNGYKETQWLQGQERPAAVAGIGYLFANSPSAQARHLTQERMAELLSIGQDSVSRLERRSDLLLSTLQSYVKVMGGSLKLVVEFPEGVAVLSGLGQVAEEKEPPKRKRTRPTAIASKRKHLEHASHR
jgi:hypothetical protein